MDELEEPDETTLTVIDFMVLARMICTKTSKCNTFGDLSDALLKAVTGMFKYGSNVDVVLKALKEFEGGKCECKR